MYLNFFWECGRKHESVSDTSSRHVVLVNDTTDLIFKTHVQHAISLIQNKVPVKSPSFSTLSHTTVYNFNQNFYKLMYVEIVLT